MSNGVTIKKLSQSTATHGAMVGIVNICRLLCVILGVDESWFSISDPVAGLHDKTFVRCVTPDPPLARSY